MWNSQPTDDNAQSDDVFIELPSFWGAVGELGRDPEADGGIFPPDPPQPRTSGFIRSALSRILQFLLEGFAASGYAMCPYVIDPAETFETWEERRRAHDAVPRDGGASRETCDKW